MRHRADGEPDAYHTAQRSVPSDDLAFARVASQTQSRADEMGEHEIKSLRTATMESEKKRAVFLDRDGVINRALEREGKPYPPTSLSEFEILSEVPAACV